MSMFEVWLPTGLGVRYEELSPDAIDGILAAAIADVGDSGTVIHFQRVAGRLGSKAMLRAVSKQRIAAAKDQEEASGKPETWRPITDSDRQDGAGWNRLFTTREQEFLAKLYDKVHGAGESEVAAVLGKSKTVT